MGSIFWFLYYYCNFLPICFENAEPWKRHHLLLSAESSCARGRQEWRSGLGFACFQDTCWARCRAKAPAPPPLPGIWYTAARVPGLRSGSGLSQWLSRASAGWEVSLHPSWNELLGKKNQDYPSVLWGLNTSLQQQKFSFIVLLLKTCFYWALYYIFPLKIGESEPCGMADVSAGSGALQTGGQLSAHRTPPSPSEGAEWQGWPLPWCACFCWWSAHSCRLTIILFSFPSPV